MSIISVRQRKRPCTTTTGKATATAAEQAIVALFAVLWSAWRWTAPATTKSTVSLAKS